jgi:hypothetical protein
MVSSGMEFEDYVYDIISRNFPARDGWSIEPQKELRVGLRVDYVVFRGSERAVIEAKDVQVLTLGHIDQVLDYRSEYKAQLAIIYIAADTELSESAKEYGDLQDVKIVRTGWRR